MSAGESLTQPIHELVRRSIVPPPVSHRRRSRIRRMAVPCAVVASALAVPRSVSSQEVGAAFLLLPASTRAMAMGGSAVAASGTGALFDDVTAVATDRLAGALALQRHLAGTTAATAAIGFRLDGWSLATGVHLLDLGEIEEVVPDPGSGGEVGVPTGARVSASDFALAVGAARGFGGVRGGIVVKLVRQQVAEASGHAVAADASVRVPLPARAVLALGLQHLGGRIELSGRDAELPALWRAGLALAPYAVRSATVQVVGEVSGARGGHATPALGGEVGWAVSPSLSLAGRLGLRAVPDEDEGSPLSVGGALIGARIGIGYAYRGYGGLGGVHRVEVSIGTSRP